MEPMVTKCPVPRRTRCGTRARVTRKGARRFTAIVRENSSGVVSTTGLMKKMPALFTTTSGTPRSVSTRPRARSTATGSVTSQRRSVRPSAVPSTRVRASRTTCAPAAYRSSATASPIPRDAPVTSASFPARAVGDASLTPGPGCIPAAGIRPGSSDLGETDQAAVRQVGDVRPAEEGEQVVLAQRVDLDVAHAHQVLVPLAVQRVADHVRDRHVVAAGEPLEGRLDAGRRLTQALPARVLAELVEHLADETFERRARAG